MSTESYTAAKSGETRARATDARGLTERIYRSLRRDCLEGALPLGQRIVEEQLARRFGTSRTPVREALRRLEGDGHLIRDPHGALVPNPPKVAPMRERYEVRIALEQLVVARAAREGDREALEALRDTWRTIEIPADCTDFVYADEDFHLRLAEASNNAVAAAYLRDVNERIRVLRIHDFLTEDRIAATIEEHLAIVEYVLAGRAQAAADLIRVHIERSAAVVESRVSSALAHMLGSAGETRKRTP